MRQSEVLQFLEPVLQQLCDIGLPDAKVSISGGRDQLVGWCLCEADKFYFCDSHDELLEIARLHKQLVRNSVNKCFMTLAEVKQEHSRLLCGGGYTRKEPVRLSLFPPSMVNAWKEDSGG